MITSINNSLDLLQNYQKKLLHDNISTRIKEDKIIYYSKELHNIEVSLEELLDAKNNI